jgi:hypothetical protein
MRFLIICRRGIVDSKSQRFFLFIFHSIILTDCLQTKKKRPTRRVPYDDDPTQEGHDNGEVMVVDEKPLPKRVVDLNANFVDDEELQAALARQRRAKMKERHTLKPEDIARKGKSC